MSIRAVQSNKLPNGGEINWKKGKDLSERTVSRMSSAETRNVIGNVIEAAGMKMKEDHLEFAHLTFVPYTERTGAFKQNTIEKVNPNVPHA